MMNSNAAAHFRESLVSDTPGLGCPKERIAEKTNSTDQKEVLSLEGIAGNRLKKGTVSSTTKLSDSLSER